VSLRIVIPVKPFDEAKSRLAPELDADSRARLARQLFLHVFETVRKFANCRNVIVVSRAAEVLTLAEAAGAIALRESSPPELNAALDQTAQFTSKSGATRILVVASDLPLLSPADLAALAQGACSIAPDRHRRGTNALLWPVVLGFRFGADSFENHAAAARAAGFDPVIVLRRGLAHDVDVPDDLKDLPF
jgi:2-phospho-L-lactate guanylyltransferase